MQTGSLCKLYLTIPGADDTILLVFYVNNKFDVFNLFNSLKKITK